MRDKLTKLHDLDAQLLAVDPHDEWSAKFLLKETGFKVNELTFPLLTDAALTASAIYGVAFQMRIHVEVSNRPATFIIDRQGVLRYAKRAETFADRPTPDEIVAELRKFDTIQ